MGSEESLIPSGPEAVSSDWAIARELDCRRTGRSGVLLTFQGAGNSPVLNGSLTIGLQAGLTLEPGGALTVNGDLTITAEC